MRITRDVVTDLLPLYASGEASADTRALVEEYLRADAEFAATVQASAQGMDAMFPPMPDQPAEHGERAALERSRMLLRRRSWTMALAIFFTLLPFTFAFDSAGVTFLMIRDEPGSALFLVSAAWLWFHYYQLQQRLRGTGL